jgi:raffinose/stachyose/melibiose transport system substrate-binding protein
VVNAKTKHLAEAKKFIEFATQPNVASEVAAASGFVSIGDAASGTRPEYQSEIAPLLKDGKTISFPLFTWPDPALFIALSTDVQGILTGQKTTADVLSGLDEAWPKS